MRVPDDRNAAATKGLDGPSRPHTAALLTLPVSWHHTVRSVAQQAFKTLWAEEPDRAERWRRVGNMDQIFGVGRPLRSISKVVVDAAVHEMHEIGMPEDDVGQHLDNFACLMIWADMHNFIRWGRDKIHIAE
jgi:hypothetical protein